jgi:hypothetical protein
MLLKVKQLNYYITKDQKTANLKVDLLAQLMLVIKDLTLQKKTYHFIRKKKSGKPDSSCSTSGLKELQKSIKLIFQCVYEPHKAAWFS